MQRDETIEAAAEALWQDYVRSTRRAEPRLAWALADVARRDVPTRVGRLATWRVGEGPAVLLIHGMADDHTIWAPMMAALAERGTPHVVFDLPGHGLSEGDRITLSMAAEAVEDIVAACGAIGAIVGHSLGGLSAAVALARGLPVDRAVLMSVTKYRLVGLLNLAAERGADDCVIERMKQLHAERFGDDDLAINIPTIADQIDARLLFVHSIDDERVPYTHSQAGHAACRNAELWLPAGPNHRQTARDPAVIARVLDFVDS